MPASLPRREASRMTSIIDIGARPGKAPLVELVAAPNVCSSSECCLYPCGGAAHANKTSRARRCAPLAGKGRALAASHRALRTRGYDESVAMLRPRATMDSFEQEMLISSWTRESAKRELRRARALCREVQTEAMSVSRGSPKVTERGEVGDSKSDVPDESRADPGTGEPEQTASAAEGTLGRGTRRAATSTDYGGPVARRRRADDGEGGGADAQGETREGAGLCGDQQEDVRRD
mmetsp:Transcript_16600/g.47942  ORF Transcript_16600/g.47942 Transcript_16600/m.47942 type:complete len:235 (-) Transcript_16600:1537-2241(-)